MCVDGEIRLDRASSCLESQRLPVNFALDGHILCLYAS